MIAGNITRLCARAVQGHYSIWLGILDTTHSYIPNQRCCVKVQFINAMWHGCHGVSNYMQLHCWFNHFCRRTVVSGEQMCTCLLPKWCPWLIKSPRYHDDVIKWKIFRVTGICAGNSPVTGEFLAKASYALMFSLISAWINGWVNNCGSGDLRPHRAHYDVIVMLQVARVMLVIYIQRKNHGLSDWL